MRKLIMLQVMYDLTVLLNFLTIKMKYFVGEIGEVYNDRGIRYSLK